MGEAAERQRSSGLGWYGCVHAQLRSEAELRMNIDDEWRCYRHPARDAGVRCRRCERPICPDCMIPAPVGFQCPSCVRSAPAVKTMRDIRTRSGPLVTTALVALNLAVFVPTLGDSGLIGDFGLFGPAVADGEWWRLATSGFIHVNLLHVGFNCLLLWQLGGLLEPALGRLRFGFLYAAAVLAGSVGVLLLDPLALTAGASGGVFGLMGAAVLGLRQRGINPMQTGLGGLLVVNLVLTFAVPGISIGGHLGGLAGGAALGAYLFANDGSAAGRTRSSIGAIAAVAALAAAGLWLAANPI